MRACEGAHMRVCVSDCLCVRVWADVCGRMQVRVRACTRDATHKAVNVYVCARGRAWERVLSYVRACVRACLRACVPMCVYRGMLLILHRFL